MFALTTDPAVDSGYANLDYALYFAQGTYYVYRNGTGTASLGSYVAGDVFTITYTGYSVIYRKGETVIYHHAAPPGLSLYFDSTLDTPNSIMTAVEFGPTNAVAPRGNLLDPGSWVPGSNSTQGVSAGAINGYNVGGAFFAYTAFFGDNNIVWTTGPDGNGCWAWEAKGGGAANSGGGWLGGMVPIDPTRPYRLSVWVKNTVMSGTFGNVYLGCSQDGGVTDLATGAANTNPYPVVLDRSYISTDRWYLLVGVIHPYNFGTTPPGQPTSGVYDAVTGALIQGPSAHYKWASAAYQSYLRTFIYYADTSQRTMFLRPRFEVMDGTEMSIDDLLAEARPGRAGTTPILFGEQLGLNGQFTQWGVAGLGQQYPTNWSVWSNPNSTINRETTIVRSGPNAVRMSNASASGEVGIQWAVNLGSGKLEVDSYLEIECDAYVVSNTSGGNPGVYFVVYTTYGSVYTTVYVQFDKTKTGAWQTVKANWSPPKGLAIDGILIYLMCSWTSAPPSGKWLGDIIIDNLVVNVKRPKDTPQIVTGAVSGHQGYVDDPSAASFGNPGNATTSGDTGNASLTTTGAPVNVIAMFELWAIPNNTAVDRVALDVNLRVDGGVIRTTSTYLWKTHSISGGVACYASIPFVFRHTPSAAAHNYDFSYSFTLRDSSNASATPNGGTWSLKAAIIAQEMKV
jgi:hypothetical protein